MRRHRAPPGPPGKFPRSPAPACSVLCRTYRHRLSRASMHRAFSPAASGTGVPELVAAQIAIPIVVAILLAVAAELAVVARSVFIALSLAGAEAMAFVTIALPCPLSVRE